MICLECKGENFILSTTKLVTEKFKIQKNGKLAKTPYYRYEDTDTSGEWDNIVICTNCSAEFAIKHVSHDDLIDDFDFSKVDLEKDGVVYDV